MSDTAGPQAAPSAKISTEKIVGQEIEQPITSGREMGFMAIGSHAPPDPRQVMRLQRLIGNRATISTLSTSRPRLQRDMDPQALREAMEYYAAHADDYPPILVRRVQTAVGATPTGRINESTVIAISRYQDPDTPPTMLPLRSSGNGILTREEMLDLVAVGLEERSERTAYVEGAGELSARWASLSPDERVNEFERLGNERLRSIGVPEIDFVSSDTLPPQTAGFTDNMTWQIQINEQILISDVLPVDAISTVYHEIRHAEQYFLAQRYEIQTNRIIEELNTPFRFPFNDWGGQLVRADIIEIARSTPLLVGRERELARMMAHRFTHDTDPINESLMTQLTETFCAARERQESNPSAENQRVMDEANRAYRVAHRVYAAWWHEADSGVIESLIAGEYIEAHPDVPRTPAIDVCE